MEPLSTRVRTHRTGTETSSAEDVPLAPPLGEAPPPPSPSPTPTPTAEGRHRSWFERLSYAAVVGAVLALPLGRLPAQQPGGGPPRTGATPMRMLVDERSGKPTTLTTQDLAHTPAVHQELNQLYHGVLRELRALYQDADPARLQAAANQVSAAVLERATADWQPHERAALQRVLHTVHQLAGADGHFNHGDTMAVVHALLADKAGLLRMAHQQIDQRMVVGNRIAHRLVDNAYTPTRHYQRTGHAGVLQRMRDRRADHIETQASGAIQAQLHATLARLGVDPITAQRLDPMVRNLGFEQVLGLERDLQVLQPRFAELAERLRRSPMGPVVQELRTLLSRSTVMTAAPLRGGVPDPQNLDAVIRTALDALDGVQITRDLRGELAAVHTRAVQTLRELSQNALANDPAIEQQAQRLVDAALARATASWPADEKAALSRICDTLDQLAGGDGRFNYGDKLAIVEALVKDQGPVQRVVVGRLAGAQLDATLARLGVDRQTANTPDATPRKLTVEQLKQLDLDLKRVAARLSQPATGAGDDTLTRFRAEVTRLMDGQWQGQAPLRNGVPSPRNVRALIDTALDALDSFRLAPPR